MLLGTLLRLGYSLGMSGWSDNSWNIRAPKEVQYLPRNGPLDTALDELLFRHFQHRHVYGAEDRQQRNMRATLERAKGLRRLSEAKVNLRQRSK